LDEGGPLNRLQQNKKNKSLYLSVMVFSTVVVAGDTINEETNIVNRTENLLKIRTGLRLTTWLFTRREGVEFGATEQKSI